MSYKQWMRFLAQKASELGFREVGEDALPMRGRARVLFGRF